MCVCFLFSGCLSSVVFYVIWLWVVVFVLFVWFVRLLFCLAGLFVKFSCVEFVVFVLLGLCSVCFVTQQLGFCLCLVLALFCFCCVLFGLCIAWFLLVVLCSFGLFSFVYLLVCFVRFVRSV